MKHIKYARTFEVLSKFPKKLEPLKKLAYNLRWSWHHPTKLLFKSINKVLWTELKHNPVALINSLSEESIKRLLSDAGFMKELKHCENSLDNYLSSSTWFQKSYPDEQSSKIAYFCAEFGINECLPIYSGGLGILAGDHLKAASDLGLPLVGVGLLYTRGYFKQFITPDGWQQEKYPEYNYFNMPINLVKDEHNQPLKISVDFPDRKVFCHIWKAEVGRTPLYLLDSNVLENDHFDKSITDTLYGGNEDMRIRQEIILGIGGMKALEALGITPTVCHMNEGHAAFLSLERTRQLMEKNGLDYDEAKNLVSSGNVFTTHTPVPAGFDLFHNSLIDKYLTNAINAINLPVNRFLSEGVFNEYSSDGLFNMALYAMSNTNTINGVSKLHAKVSQGMFHEKWPNLSISEVPIQPVTNGIHVETWISNRMSRLFDRYLGSDWRNSVECKGVWEKVDAIPDKEIWNIRENQRADLVRFARKRAAKQHYQKSTCQKGAILDPRILTIGFARRFATYKRATLLFSDIERLKNILHHAEHPVQIIFAGKSHPRDDGGKKYIQDIINYIQKEEGVQRILFLEDYDMDVATKLVQGVDVWLNNPRRPLEASGTSGMKVLANGGLNCSILDGWWAEGYHPDCGWAIGDGEEYNDPGYQDWIDSNSLYDIIEKEIVPKFYHRNTDGIPENWIKMVKESIKKLTPEFSTRRMVQNYTDEHYMLAAKAYNYLTRDSGALHEYLDWKNHVMHHWHEVKIQNVRELSGSELQQGESFEIQAEIELGNINLNDVCVETLVGTVGSSGDLNNPKVVRLNCIENIEGNKHLFEGKIACEKGGSWGYVLRVVPDNEYINTRMHLNLMHWEEDAFSDSMENSYWVKKEQIAS